MWAISGPESSLASKGKCTTVQLQKLKQVLFRISTGYLNRSLAFFFFLVRNYKRLKLTSHTRNTSPWRVYSIYQLEARYSSTVMEWWWGGEWAYYWCSESIDYTLLRSWTPGHTNTSNLPLSNLSQMDGWWTDTSVLREASVNTADDWRWSRRLVSRREGVGRK